MYKQLAWVRFMTLKTMINDQTFISPAFVALMTEIYSDDYLDNQCESVTDDNIYEVLDILAKRHPTDIMAVHLSDVGFEFKSMSAVGRAIKTTKFDLWMSGLNTEI